jgi:hypothetical protein
MMFRYPLHRYLEKQPQQHVRCRGCHRLLLAAITTTGRPSSFASFSTRAKPNFRSWYAREEKEERGRLALASYLRDLYGQVQHPSSHGATSSSSEDVAAELVAATSSLVRFRQSLTPENEQNYLTECLLHHAVPDERLLHDTIVDCERHFHSRHNINIIAMEHDERHHQRRRRKIVVVGDIHGDLASLAHIYRTHGPPSESLVYVFNGDICDRGTQSTEVLYFILNLVLKYPDGVYVNRGNHEDVYMNDAYGFHDELCNKYGVHTSRVLRTALDRLYVSLPLCTWIPYHKTFIVHAGPPLRLNSDYGSGGGGGATTTSATEIGLIHRHKYSRTACKTARDRSDDEKREGRLLETLLWSDPNPQMSASGILPSDRGAGVIYSLDSCLRWMTDNGVDNLIRSHQCVQFGYERMRGEGDYYDGNNDDSAKSVYTVFSSSDYRGAGNDGAVLLLTKDGEDKNIITPETYNADDFITTSVFQTTAQSSSSNDRKKNDDPHCQVTYSKEVIRSIFRLIDTNGDGVLSKDEIERGLQLAKDFKTQNDTDVENFVVGERDGNMGKDLQTIFDVMDKDGSGGISIDEFVNAFYMD